MNKIFKTWNQTEHQTWKRLAERQFPNLQGKMSQLWFDGWKELGMELNKVPDFDDVSQTLTDKTGWHLLPTTTVFLDGETWFQLLQKQQMIVSDYLRPLDSLDYTPLPDAFHDAFGHLPFFANQQFCTMVAIFSQRMLTAQPAERQALGHIWWYSVEFGLIKEKGQVKAFGAGLASSFAELNKVFSGQIQQTLFDPDVVATVDESHHQQHDKLFVLESLEQLMDIAQNWTLSSQ